MNERVPKIQTWLLARARILLVLTLVGVLLGHLGEWHWFAELFSHFFIQYWLVAALLSLVFSACRAWSWALAAFSLWFVCCLALLLFYRTGAALPGEGRQELRLLQFNVAQQVEPLEAWLAEEGAPLDMLLLMEVTPEFAPLFQRLEVRFPHQLLRLEEGPFGIALLSRHPFVRAEVLEPMGPAYPGLDVSLSLAGRSLRILGIHPPPPLGAQLAGQRNGYMDRLQMSLGAGEPALVVGDFNSTVWSPRLQAFMAATGLQDCQRGLGLAPTWPAGSAGVPGIGQGLGIPIDLCLYSGAVQVLERGTGGNLGSDHMPVVNRIAF